MKGKNEDKQKDQQKIGTFLFLNQKDVGKDKVTRKPTFKP